MPSPTFLAYAHLSGPLDYNKIPLAPMGNEAQVHKKTDKCETWAYNLVNGWYLFTLPEHYCTHNCHIKHTKSKRLSDMVQFQHKRITNPSITHANKMMHALGDCIKANQGKTGKARNSQAAQGLQQMLMQHRPIYRHILTNLRKPQHRMITVTRTKFLGCGHYHAFPEPILMITEESHAPCNSIHQFQGCPPISLPASLPARP